MRRALALLILFVPFLMGCPQPSPTPTPPSITLGWSDKDAPYISSYKVLCGSVSGGPYSLVMTVAGTAPTAQYTGVTAGQVLYCVVQAVDSQGDVSALSNEETYIGGTNEVATIRIPRSGTFTFASDSSTR
jgi:hypothetical protein